MVEKILQTEILLELVFSVSGEIDEKLILKKSIPLYLKKLNCFFAGVLKNHGEAQEEFMLMPFVASKSAEWLEVKKYFVDQKPQNQHTCSQHLFKESNYYAFCLASYGTLILGRQLPFDDAFIHELEPVINHLGKILIQAKELDFRIKAENALKESEEKYRFLFVNNPQPSWIYDLESLAFLEVNDAAINHYGYSREEFQTMTLKDIRPPEDVNALLKDVEQTTDEYNIAGEWRHLKKNGELMFVEITSHTVLFNNKHARHVLVNDITERKLTENALHKSEERFRTIFNESPIGIEFYEADGSQKETNKASLKMFGITDSSEIENFNLFDGTSLDFSKKEMLRKGVSINYESIFDFEKVKGLQQYNTKREGKANFDYIITPLKDAKQKTIDGYLLQVQEITERKRSEQVQKVLYHISNAVLTSADLEQLIGEIRSELGTVIDTSNFFIALYDEKTDSLTLPFIADEKDKLTSFPAGKTCTNYVIKSQKSLLANKAKVEELEKFGAIELVGTPSEIWLGVPLIIEGKVTGVLAVQSYTNENAYTESDMKMLEFISGQISTSINRKKAEKELLRAKEAAEISEKQFKTMFEKAPIGIALVDSITGQIYQANSKHASIAGRTKEELSETDWKSFTHPEDVELNLKKLKQMLDGKIKWFQIEKRIFQKDGKLVWVNLVVEPIEGFDKPNPCHLAMYEDITEKKKIMDDLIEAKEKAEESDRLKSAFLANMSHEIRTPMNGILGFAELLKEPQLTGVEQQKYIGIIEKSGVRMLNIINDIINISKVESGQMEISISDTNVNEQIEYIYNFFKPETEQKGIRLMLKNSLPSKEAIISTDQEKVYAIFTNLVKNAIKFTPKGSIEIGYNLINSPTGQSELEFYVRDTGLGIRDDLKTTVFERFRQGSEMLTRNYEGSGLGLSISKAYVEMLGGKIWVEDSKDQGSIFYFTLPYRSSLGEKHELSDGLIDSKENPQINPEVSGLKILVVEDDEASEILVTRTVKTLGKEILKARTGKEAVDICRNHPDLDLVLMDIKMPVMDGYEATRQIRQFNKKVIIIAQTAYALAGDQEKAMEAGCNDYISKPIIKEVLLAKIEKLLGPI